MPITYCFSCSEKIKYDILKPKQCPHCKQSPHASIDITKETKASKPKSFLTRRSRHEEEEEYEDYTEVPRLDCLKARINIVKDVNKQTFGNIIDSEINKISSQQPQKKGRGRPKKQKLVRENTRSYSDNRSFEESISDGRGNKDFIDLGD